ncbi:peptidoglycan DD-metalloendopeptidase family protein [Neobacillus drentensis]
MYRITSTFGAKESVRNFHSHSGIDFVFPLNEPIRTIKDGVIEKITHYKGNIGNGVLVRWNEGKISIYGHRIKLMKVFMLVIRWKPDTFSDLPDPVAIVQEYISILDSKKEEGSSTPPPTLTISRV